MSSCGDDIHVDPHQHILICHHNHCSLSCPESSGRCQASTPLNLTDRLGSIPAHERRAVLPSCSDTQHQATPIFSDLHAAANAAIDFATAFSRIAQSGCGWSVN